MSCPTLDAGIEALLLPNRRFRTTPPKQKQKGEEKTKEEKRRGEARRGGRQGFLFTASAFHRREQTRQCGLSMLLGKSLFEAACKHGEGMFAFRADSFDTDDARGRTSGVHDNVRYAGRPENGLEEEGDKGRRGDRKANLDTRDGFPRPVGQVCATT